MEGRPEETQRDESKDVNEDTFDVDFFVQHDIPPPVLIGDGSLRVESDVDFTETGAAGPFTYERPSSGSDTGFGHIRILHGNGEMIYQDLTPDPASTLDIVLKDDRGATRNVRVTGGGAFRVTTDVRLARNPGHGRKRPKALNHPPITAGRDFRIESMEIKDRFGVTKFRANARVPPTNNFSEEFRILIWLH